MRSLAGFFIDALALVVCCVELVPAMAADGLDYVACALMRAADRVSEECGQDAGE